MKTHRDPDRRRDQDTGDRFNQMAGRILHLASRCGACCVTGQSALAGRKELRKLRVLNELGADQREITKHLRIGKALDQMRWS